MCDKEVENGTGSLCSSGNVWLRAALPFCRWGVWSSGGFIMWPQVTLIYGMDRFVTGARCLMPLSGRHRWILFMGRQPRIWSKAWWMRPQNQIPCLWDISGLWTAGTDDKRLLDSDSGFCFLPVGWPWIKICLFVFVCLFWDGLLYNPGWS